MRDDLFERSPSVLTRLKGQQLAREKFRGAMLGAIIGDALGAPFEGSGPIHRSFFHRWESSVPHPLRYTDDGHMTLGVASSLVESRGFDGARMAKTLLRRYHDEPWRGYGNGPPEVFDLLEKGVPWDEAGSRIFDGKGSYGNGAAMRIAPVALLACYDLDRVEQIARLSALITHAHPWAREAAVMQACGIASLLHSDPGQPLQVGALAETIRQHLATSMLRRAFVRAMAMPVEASWGQVTSGLGNGVQAFRSVPTAFYSFIRTSESFPEVIYYAIGLGGDTDTIASMAGALSGAFLGERAIPEPWRSEVEDAREAVRLADELWEVAHLSKERGP